MSSSGNEEDDEGEDDEAEVSAEDMEETEEEEEDGEEELSDTSYDEGSYDGRQGKIVYTCKDDEAIARGAPGAQMYDQNIRETYVCLLPLTPHLSSADAHIITSCRSYPLLFLSSSKPLRLWSCLS